MATPGAVNQAGSARAAQRAEHLVETMADEALGLALEPALQRVGGLSAAVISCHASSVSGSPGGRLNVKSTAMAIIVSPYRATAAPPSLPPSRR